MPTLILDPLFLPSAVVAKPYATQINASGGTAPYVFSLLSGALPPGLNLGSDGSVTGTALIPGAFTITLQATDAASSTVYKVYTITSSDQISLSDLTVEQEDFVTQFNSELSTKPAWSTALTGETSQSMVEAISTVGNFNTNGILRTYEDAFPETAQSDSALRAIALMQGLRITRKMPAAVSATLTATENTYIPPYTQFVGVGNYWFNPQGITLVAHTPLVVALSEGQVVNKTVAGLGGPLQSWVSPEDQFVVSDRDVVVTINGVELTKTFGGLWNYPSTPAFQDLTLSNGRLVLQFGTANYASMPGVSDIVGITYVLTKGTAANAIATLNAKITVPTNPIVTGVFSSSPTGGANEKDPVTYKSFSAGSFGTHGSAVTKGHYQALANSYPGVVDAIVQAQRDINPMALEWMNTMRVSALATSPWTTAMVRDYIGFLANGSMYAPHFVFVQPIPIVSNVAVDIYVFNSVKSIANTVAIAKAAITKLFSPRPGLLLTNIYPWDIEATINAALPSQISYIVVKSPTSVLNVGSPASPKANYTISASGGSLGAAQYSYSISTDAPSPLGGTDIGAPSNWQFPQIISGTTNRISLDWSFDAVPGATAYHVWGRLGGTLGRLATLAGSVTSWTDTGSVVPDVSVPVNSVADVGIRYNQLGTLTVNAYYADRQTQASLPSRVTT